MMMCKVVSTRKYSRRAPPGRGVADGGRNFDIPERALWKLWKRRAALQEEFRTGSGRRVRVLYPGRTGSSAGPDFRDALLEVEGVGVVRGDVEIHLHQKDWAAHGHGDDPNYNGVVVHAALAVDAPDTVLRSGASVPVIGLEGLLTADDAGESSPAFDLWALLAGKGFSQPGSGEEAAELLDRAGDERFMAKSSALARFTWEQGAEQTLYEALLEGLGYRHNRQPFIKLAQNAPYETLRNAALRVPFRQRDKDIFAWLLGVSGLAGPDVAAQPRPKGLRRTMALEEWRLFRVRPPNHPENRLKGAGRLMARHLDAGLIEGLDSAAATGRAATLTKSLAVDGEGTGAAAYIGVGRARELAVNSVLPLLHATAGSSRGANQEAELLRMFRVFPKLPDNEVVREMVDQLFPKWPGVASSARRQQGLLHLAALLRGASA